ncbi:MAG: carboxylesterase family protein [Chitinophagaceae bacterium]|nr:carboxylesterase family protein [Chitinophagaceae bacterium]
MKNNLLALACYLLTTYSLDAQQWVVQKYSYDSILNVTYGSAINFNGGTDSLTMDIYLPQCDMQAQTTRRPLMLWIHGGAFLAGNKDESSIQSFCKSFAKRGYVTATINYRLGFISDDNLWQCNYPNYSCVFSGDSAEWVRAYYRSVQDAKGALRYLVNRHQQFRIDTSNIFVCGESAGAFTALGVGLMDTLIERPLETFALPALPKPNTATASCEFNLGKLFTSNTIARPDLGGIEGSIEPTSIKYQIKGIGNMYGGMLSNLLTYHNTTQAKPAIYSFHQPCDMVVPIDSNYVFWGLSWCFTNGYNCYGIQNNHAMLYGSRAISTWNTQQSLGYSIQNEFTTTNFPYSFLFGQASCTDQVNNPCHAYDNRALRENNLTNFFAPLVSTNPVCDTGAMATTFQVINDDDGYFVYPNPSHHILYFKCLNTTKTLVKATLYSTTGKSIFTSKSDSMNISSLTAGIYILELIQSNGKRSIQKISVQ